jgi:DSF synthase
MSTFQAKQALLDRPGNDDAVAAAALAPFPLQPASFDFAAWDLRHLELEFEAATGALWMRFTHPERPCFSTGLLGELTDVVNRMSACGRLGLQPEGLQYLVRASKHPDVWCYGGDLAHFVACIRAGDADGLRAYAHRCVDLVHHNYRSFDLPITTIGLVQGDALGGGFESLLSDDVIIAERGVRMGLPEILFNLFPGMGAYSFLARKVGGGIARRMITSGELYTAEQLYEMGVVDVLANPGEAEGTLRQYVAKNARRRRTLDVLRAVDRRSQEVTYDELIDVTELWVQRALELEPQDLRKMERLAQSQTKRLAG